MLVVCPMEILSLFLKLFKKIKFPWTGSNLGLSLTLFLHLTTRTEFLFLVLKFDFLYFWAKNQRDFQSKRFLVTKIIFWNIWSQKMFWDIWSQNWISPQNFLFFPNFRYTTDFTSVSQQNHFASRYALQNQHNNKGANSKPYWTREKRKRYRRQRSPPSSFLSSTFDDTEVSMSLDVITVFMFNLKK